MTKLFQFLICLVITAQGGIANSQEAKPPVIFIVHGTYDASANWATIRTGKITFASEVKRGFGSECDIIPFLWKTDVAHETRVAAAKSLAKELDSEKLNGRRIFIIAHSHGGNVALECLRYSDRFVDGVFCLSTPHLYLTAKKDDRSLSIPIYCSPKTRAQVGKIVSLCSDRDQVVGFYAGLRKGISDQTAVEWTSDWRALSGHPRLIDDGGPIQDLLEDWFSITISRNLKTSTNLEIGDINIVLPCEPTQTSTHSITHSGRIGYILGSCIHDGVDTEVESYLSSLVLKSDLGDGSPESRNSYGTWWNANIENFTHSGWLLKSISSEATSSKKDNGENWDLDRSFPDVFFDIRGEGEVSGKMTKANIDSKTVQSFPRFHLPKNTSPEIRVYDLDVTRWERIGTLREVAPEENLRGKFELEGLKIRVEWEKVHY